MYNQSWLAHCNIYVVDAFEGNTMGTTVSDVPLNGPKPVAGLAIGTGQDFEGTKIDVSAAAAPAVLGVGRPATRGHDGAIGPAEHFAATGRGLCLGPHLWPVDHSGTDSLRNGAAHNL